jgi:hypothetical protein
MELTSGSPQTAEATNNLVARDITAAAVCMMPTLAARTAPLLRTRTADITRWPLTAWAGWFLLRANLQALMIS